MVVDVVGDSSKKYPVSVAVVSFVGVVEIDVVVVGVVSEVCVGVVDVENEIDLVGVAVVCVVGVDVVDVEMDVLYVSEVVVVDVVVVGVVVVVVGEDAKIEGRKVMIEKMCSSFQDAANNA